MGERATLKLPEAAEYLGISVEVLRTMVREGKLVVVRMNHKTRVFMKTDLDAYLNKCRMVRNTSPLVREYEPVDKHTAQNAV